jgi:hypothetical protein
LVCSHCGEKVTAREFRAHPGPGSVPATATA